MQFFTTTKINPLKQKIDHESTIFSLGSCFAENIARKLAESKFTVFEAPSGILFNPESIARSLEIYHCNKQLAAEDLMLGDEGWFGYDFHSSLSHPDKTRAIQQMQSAISKGHQILKDGDVVLITFGTAWIYRLTQTQCVVANCHKQPQHLFNRELLTVENIVERYSQLMESVLQNKRVIFTVSPIRHLGDGLEDNSLSKAILRVAINNIVTRYKNAHYFPSFEIVNDELRDYRFYAEDMIHPSTTAIEYIWERFSQYAFSAATNDIIKRIGRIADAVGHRPFNPQTEAYHNFCLKMLGEIAAMECVVAGIDLTKEKQHFKQYL